MPETGFLMVRSVPNADRRAWAAEAAYRGITQGRLVALAVALLKAEREAQS